MRGPDAVRLVALSSFVYSKPPKKNVRFFTIGPPKVPPNWL